MFNPMGCHSARNMIHIEEYPCPVCGKSMELFIREGVLAVDCRCEACGNSIPSGTNKEEITNASD